MTGEEWEKVSFCAYLRGSDIVSIEVADTSVVRYWVVRIIPRTHNYRWVLESHLAADTQLLNLLE